jgi:hypothetical protein
MVPKYICGIAWECEWLSYGLYWRTQHGGLFNMVARSQDAVPPYLLRDKGYMLLPSLWPRIKKKGSNIQFWNYYTTANTKGGGLQFCQHVYKQL